MSEDNTLLLQRAEQLRAHLATLLDSLYRQQPSPGEAAEDMAHIIRRDAASSASILTLYDWREGG